jgi:hypothetical protein
MVNGELRMGKWRVFGSGDLVQVSMVNGEWRMGRGDSTLWEVLANSLTDGAFTIHHTQALSLISTADPFAIRHSPFAMIKFEW